MTLKEQMVTDVAIFLNINEHAEEITYNGMNIIAIVDRGENMGRGNTFGSNREGQAARAEIWVAEKDIPKPKAQDEVVFDDIEWQVARILSSGGGLHQLELIGNESAWG